MLSVKGLTYRIGGRTLFENVTFNIPAGRRVGLVGPNGTGKSTLFKLITGELQADAGDIQIQAKASVSYVRQDLPEEDTKLIDIVLAADKERTALLHEAETTEDMNRIGDIYERLEQISAYDAPARAAVILSGLGFNEEAQNSPISQFSGGWRMRVALAATLFCEPDFLMLDEPTNHLDFEALIWLEGYMMKYSKTMLVISHDREILNKTVDHILHIDRLQVESYTGNYDQFERRRAEKMLNQQALHEKQMAQKAHMMKFVDRFKAKASKARQAQSRLKAIEKMDIVDAVIADRVTAFDFPEPQEMPSPVITLDGIDVGYDGRAVLKDLKLRIDQDDRIALLGANGNGKSTLVKLLSGRLEPMAGEMYRPSKLKVGYFAQHQTDELDVSRTPYELMKEMMVDKPEPKVRAALGKFGFDKHKADTKVAELSGGEKSRLLFCLMSFDAPHVMLLDEPTNHLDIDAREALVQALNNYTGAVILVSHDPHLVECVVERLWLVADGTCQPYEDDLEAYKELVINQRKKERRDARAAVKADKQEKKEKKKADNSKLEKEVKKLEQKVADLNKEKATLEAELSKAAPGKVADLSKRYAELSGKLEKAESEWISASEQLDKSA